MIHQDATSSSFIEIGRGLLEQGVDSEFKIKGFDAELGERVGKGGGLTGGLFEVGKVGQKGGT